MSGPFDYAIKFIMVGDTAVGKTSILHRYQKGTFDPAHDITIGVEFCSKIVKVDDGRLRVKVQVWDTAGQEDFKSMTRSYYRSSAAALVVYDVTRKQTFKSVKRWIEEVKEEGGSNVQIMIVANKTDLVHERIVSRAEGQKLAKDYGVGYIETSAKSFENIEQAFTIPLIAIIQKVETKLIDARSAGGITIGDPKASSIGPASGCSC